MKNSIDLVAEKILNITEKNFSEDHFQALDKHDYPPEYENLINAVNQLVETGKNRIRQEKLELENQNEVLGSFCSDYIRIYRADFRTGQCERYKMFNTPRDDIQEKIQFEAGYGPALERYAELYVADQDKDYVRNMTEMNHVLAQLKTKQKYTVRYHVKENTWQAKYFEINFVGTGKEEDHPIVIFGFRNADFIVQKEEEYKQETRQHIEEILASSRTGIWSIELEEGREPRMYGDQTMQQLLGIHQEITPEECYQHWFHHIDPDYVAAVQEAVQEILQSGRSEVTYPWSHPELGKIYVRCGGVPDRKFEKPGVCIKGYHQDITETMVTKQKQDKAIMEALAAAKQANQAKSEFLSHMSHDIRTPINGILGMLAIAEKNPDDLKKQEECRSKIRMAAEHLLSLINDVLDISKLESGALSLAKDPFDIRDVLASCMDILRPQAEEHGLHLKEQQVGLQHTRLIGSPLHLRQILINIIGNAIKYNRPNGSILVRTEELSSTEAAAVYQFVVGDTGIGMGKDFLKHIFEPFTQESKDARTSFKGAGLGMSITKKLTVQMGGTIEVESEPDKGSIFKVTLSLPIDREERCEAVQPETDMPADISGMRVLLVEDNALNSEIVQYMLEDAGAAVTIAENGKDAVDIFSASGCGTFDCILMDVMMPVMNGLEATRILRALDRPDAKTVPIIALSANAFEEDIKEAKKAGMNEYLAKPVDLNRMFRMMWRLNNKNSLS